MEGKRVVVTGGAGFIGSNLAFELAKANETIVVDNFSTGKKENLDGLDAEVVEMDINDTKRLLEIFQGVDYVFHQAALPSVVRSVDDPITSNRANIDGTLSVFEAARLAGVEKIVYASSCAVYGDTPDLPKREDMLPHPESPYAVTKESCEQYGKVFWTLYGLRNTGLRYFNVYGPRQDPSSQYAAVVPLFINWAMENTPLAVYGDGEQTRDFVFVMDVVQANIKAAESTQCDGEVLNVAKGERTSVKELGLKIGELLGKKVEFKFEATRSGDVRDSVADISWARSMAGYEPEYSMEAGLRETIGWFGMDK